MRYSIHDKTLDAKKARILINALIDRPDVRLGHR